MSNCIDIDIFLCRTHSAVFVCGFILHCVARIALVILLLLFKLSYIQCIRFAKFITARKQFTEIAFHCRKLSAEFIKNYDLTMTIYLIQHNRAQRSTAQHCVLSFDNPIFSTSASCMLRMYAQWRQNHLRRQYVLGWCTLLFFGWFCFVICEWANIRAGRIICRLKYNNSLFIYFFTSFSLSFYERLRERVTSFVPWQTDAMPKWKSFTFIFMAVIHKCISLNCRRRHTRTWTYSYLFIYVSSYLIYLCDISFD